MRRTITEYQWEQTPAGYWVVESVDGNGIRTGPFPSRQRGKQWFDRVLGIKLVEQTGREDIEAKCQG